mmetsp:Transcript_96869/g.252609  ORF Transcript_96869/g.252609 Transcript_96869/m.252609 type:complete len:90 (-) Transcript_96869:19-288(-)
MPRRAMPRTVHLAETTAAEAPKAAASGLLVPWSRCLRRTRREREMVSATWIERSAPRLLLSAQQGSVHGPSKEGCRVELLIRVLAVVVD